MKKNFFKVLFSSFLLVVGFSSCKKDCEDCFSYTDGTDTYTYCESYFDTKAEYNAYITLIEAAGYTINEFKVCE